VSEWVSGLPGERLPGVTRGYLGLAGERLPGYLGLPGERLPGVTG
jgi:hypothetical protein